MLSSTCQFDDFDVPRFSRLAAGFGADHYGYVVTPNADHLIRLQDDAGFRASYADASFVVLDSRFLSHLLRVTRRLSLPVCPGSDLTAALFSEVVKPDDRLVLIGGSDEQAQRIAAQYGLKQLAHYNPPMGFIRNPAEVEACLRFIESHSPFRFCFIGVGAPQQEYLAQQLKLRGVARGLALCIGASINFLTGSEKRAPRWMQVAGLEWLYRLLQAPERMAKRYLVRGPRVFGILLAAKIVLRGNWHAIGDSAIRNAVCGVLQLKQLRVGDTIRLDELQREWLATGLRRNDLFYGVNLLRKELYLSARETPGELMLNVQLPLQAERAEDSIARLLDQARQRRRSGPSATERRKMAVMDMDSVGDVPVPMLS